MIGFELEQLYSSMNLITKVESVLEQTNSSLIQLAILSLFDIL